MKIIFSRKGFDSSYGGIPSPILEDGTIISFPIPGDVGTKGYNIQYKDLHPRSCDLGKLLDDLSKPVTNRMGKLGTKKCKVGSNDLVHLDPDICHSALPERDPEWRGLLGQCDAAQGHLRNQHVGVGDLFLFYGLYHRIESIDGLYVYDKSHNPIHLIWGWLQIGNIVDITKEQDTGIHKYPWAAYHQHYYYVKQPTNNTLYVAKENLDLYDLEQKGIKGYGVFEKYDPKLQLTDPDSDKTSHWRLPGWMYNGQVCPLSYNSKREWKLEKGSARLKSFPRGQEFVLHIEECPEAINWLSSLLIKEE